MAFVPPVPAGVGAGAWAGTHPPWAAGVPSQPLTVGWRQRAVTSPSLRVLLPPLVRMASAAAGGAPPPAPTATAAADALTTHFITACIPGPTPYAVAVESFVGAAAAAYAANLSMGDLDAALTACTVGGRRLVDADAELRSVWLSLAYKTLRAVGVQGGGGVPLAAPDRFDAFVADLVAAVRGGYDTRRIRLAQSVGTGGGGGGASPDGEAGGGSEARSPTEAAILAQSTRLVTTTLEVAGVLKKGEEPRAGGEGGE